MHKALGSIPAPKKERQKKKKKEKKRRHRKMQGQRPPEIATMQS
jgi:hypothetical protein